MLAKLIYGTTKLLVSHKTLLTLPPILYSTTTVLLYTKIWHEHISRELQKTIIWSTIIMKSICYFCKRPWVLSQHKRWAENSNLSVAVYSIKQRLNNLKKQNQVHSYPTYQSHVNLWVSNFVLPQLPHCFLIIFRYRTINSLNLVQTIQLSPLHWCARRRGS